MRPLGSRQLSALSALVALAVLGGGLTAAHADDDLDVPSRADVRAAQGAVDDGVRDVAAVRADLDAANAALERSSVAALQAAEAFNGARYAAQQARKAAKAARVADRTAQAEAERQRTDFGSMVVGLTGSRPGLEALRSMTESTGLADLLERGSAIGATTTALSGRRAALDDAQEQADAARVTADAAAEDASAAQAAARAARDTAQAAEDAARERAQALAVRKGALLGELARLQGVSLQLAERRQAGLEQRAAERAAAQAEAEAAAQAAADQAAADAAAAAAAAEAEQEAAETPTEAPSETPTEIPSETPSETPPPTETTTPDPAPAPASGAAAAVAFARAQLGEPYVWAAAGPNSWDCSGLTMGAWAAGGKSLPHYSVAQYQQSTPISASDLQPGDLVFWGSSDSSSSIYHVAMYAGDGMIIHAPRTGRPVVEESIYYWITPNFYARP